jgi:hypothetical protein
VTGQDPGGEPVRDRARHELPQPVQREGGTLGEARPEGDGKHCRSDHTHGLHLLAAADPDAVAHGHAERVHGLRAQRDLIERLRLPSVLDRWADPTSQRLEGERVHPNLMVRRPELDELADVRLPKRAEVRVRLENPQNLIRAPRRNVRISSREAPVVAVEARRLEQVMEARSEGERGGECGDRDGCAEHRHPDRRGRPPAAGLQGHADAGRPGGGEPGVGQAVCHSGRMRRASRLHHPEHVAAHCRRLPRRDRREEHDGQRQGCSAGQEDERVEAEAGVGFRDPGQPPERRERRRQEGDDDPDGSAADGDDRGPHDREPEQLVAGHPDGE